MWQVCRMDVTSLQIRCVNSVCSMWSLHTKIYVSAFKIPLLTVWYPTSLLRRAIFPLLLWMLGIDSISCSFSLYLSDFFRRIFLGVFSSLELLEKNFRFTVWFILQNRNIKKKGARNAEYFFFKILISRCFLKLKFFNFICILQFESLHKKKDKEKRKKM